MGVMCITEVLSVRIKWQQRQSAGGLLGLFDCCFSWILLFLI